MQLIDTHAHIHFDNYKLDAEEVLADAEKAGVTGIVAVSCDITTSEKSIDFAAAHKNVWAAVGVHPHEAKEFMTNSDNLQKLCKLIKGDESEKSADKKHENLVAIGECGLDYYYEHSPKDAQIKLLELHLQLAQDTGLPVIFHVRDAHDDFWPIFDNFSGLKGVLHSFSATKTELEAGLKRNLYIGLNGIMTFTRDEAQLEAARLVPKDKLVLETDAPYLTPAPFRGNICKPEHVAVTAKFLADLRGEKVEQLAAYTTKNARQLFSF